VAEGPRNAIKALDCGRNGIRGTKREKETTHQGKKRAAILSFASMWRERYNILSLSLFFLFFFFLFLCVYYPQKLSLTRPTKIPRFTAPCLCKVPDYVIRYTACALANACTCKYPIAMHLHVLPDLLGIRCCYWTLKIVFQINSINSFFSVYQ